MDDLTIWRRILASPPAAPGHRHTYAAGPCHPQTRPVPAWVTASGISLALLHAAHTAYRIAAAREACDSSAQIVRRVIRRRTPARGNVVAIRKTA